MRVFLCLLLSSFLVTANAQSVNDVRSNNEAVEQMEQENLAKASEILHSMLAEDPDLVVARLNLSTLYSLNQEPKSAMALLEELEKHISKTFGNDMGKYPDNIRELAYITKFNLAFLMSLEKKQKKAAVFKYSEALELYPRDLAAKVNIELLTQEMQQQNKKDQQNENQDKDQKDQKDQQDQKKDQQQKKDQKQDQKKNKKKKKKQPKDFKENDLKKQDVKRIFDELKRQEEKIRAKVNKQNKQERRIEKDW